MSTAPIDFDALAQKHGATPDLDSIASKYGGSGDNPPPPPAATPPQPSTGSRILSGAEDFGKGLLKGAGSTMSVADNWSREHLPAFMTNTGMGFGKPEDIPAEQQMLQPKNAMQSVGKGVEQAGEFMIPGGAEEKAAGLLPKAIQPAGRILGAGLAAGAVNKTQGGNFTTGALTGAAGGAIGEGARALAPKIAESALNIRKLDRAYKPPGSIGRSILDETSGVRPGTVAESAQNKLNTLTPQLEQAADRVSSKPSPRIAGALQAPQREIPLSREILPKKTPGGLFDAPIRQDFQEGPDLYPEAGRAPGYPEERGVEINGNERYTNGIPNPQYLPGGPHPELSGRYAPPRGTLLSRDPFVGNRQPVDEFGRVIPRQEGERPLLPDTQPNRIASIGPARGTIGSAASTAGRQGERTTLNQLAPMQEHLTRDIAGNPIPQQVTPRQLLDLKRGFGNEFVHRWNPETMIGVKGTAAQAYHDMASEFNRVVPEGAELNSRISSLIPVAKRGESAELNAPTSQRVLGRVAAHTGALTGAVAGGAAGSHHGGLLGGLAGAAAGAIAPELLSLPTGQMIVARGLNSPATRKLLLPAIAGAGLQATRGH